ncbi:hypothetical protein EPA93_06335 [Ktedonosporobacter rubrisoli]|uniref:Uncharacterized protein n=1 Tax=Ktedonosporobacter rubrisoli TaxID=2509675 RepID=A0A4P6JKY8_KTERU|nr:hypothetical protein [Ktedonosporobacter rubrisoli]QBD75642.1 hypothetical protein EPA93_06335 [Ktedonosporobacter rubrisoli]
MTNERTAQSSPAQQDVLNVLEQLNRAHRAYDVALPSEKRLQIATTFHHLYMWLLQRHIPFRYDPSRHCYFLTESYVRQEVKSL